MFKNLSKYRHVYCDAPKQEVCHIGLRLSTVTGDQQYIKASATYFVVALAGGGGLVYVGRHDRPGRFTPGATPTLRGHTGAVLDFDWNPFDDSVLATASEDTTAKLWRVPEGWEPIDDKGKSKKGGVDITESVVDLKGHAKKVNLLRFHPSASNVLASTSYDHSVKLWDVEAAREMSSFVGMPDLCQDVVWDYRGDNYATSCKDKTMRFIDARTAKVTTEFSAHSMAKGSKVVYMGESGKVLTTGHSMAAQREVKVWDLRNSSEPIERETIDSAAGILMPLYDPDTNVVYLCGKGDGNVRICAVEDKAPHFRRLNDGFRSTTPLKGACLVPKRALDVMKCESARLLKVTNDTGRGEAGIQPLSFVVPRKSDAFQEDIFPNTASSVPAHGADAWWAGSSKGPRLESLDPAKEKGPPPPQEEAPIQTRESPMQKMEMAQSESPQSVESLHERIKYLEMKLDEAGISYDKSGLAPAPPATTKKSPSRLSGKGIMRKMSRRFG